MSPFDKLYPSGLQCRQGNVYDLLRELIEDGLAISEVVAGDDRLWVESTEHD